MRGKKILNFSIISISFTVLMLAFVAVAPALASPTTLFVNAALGSDGNDCLSKDAGACATIQKAVDNAAADDTIKVDDGTYDKVTIDKDGLTLEANSSPVIDCGGTGGDSVGNGITIDADFVTIDGFEIRKCDNGIKSGVAGGVSDAIIKNNDIHDNLNPSDGGQGVGILLGGSGDNDRNTITKNTIHDNDRQGIFLGGSCFSAATSTDNVILENTIFGNGADVETTKRPDASQYGIQLCNADRNLILKNDVSDHNTWSRGVGIYLWNSDHNIVRDNELEENRVGIRISGGSHHNLIHDNQVEKGLNPDTLDDDGRAGPLLGDCPFGFTLPATGIWVLDEPCDSGLGDDFFPTSDNVIANNEVEENAGWGIDVNVDTIVAENELQKNGLGGIVVRGSGSHFFDNKSEQNLGDGFRAMSALMSTGATLGPSSDNFFVNNESKDNTGFGFRDLSIGGTGTSTTDNSYLNNKCESNTLGGSGPIALIGLLCSPQP